MKLETRERVTTVAGLVLIALFSTAQRARAYIDPGTGSLIIQILIGTFLAASWTFRKAWRKLIRRLFSHSSPLKDKDEAQ
jgi:O-antigen/teichoic acid export membrane protein